MFQSSCARINEIDETEDKLCITKHVTTGCDIRVGPFKNCFTLKIS